MYGEPIARDTSRSADRQYPDTGDVRWGRGGLLQCGTRRALQGELIESVDLDEFGAGPLHQNGDPGALFEFGEGAIKGLALVAIHDDRISHIIAACDGLGIRAQSGPTSHDQ